MFLDNGGGIDNGGVSGTLLTDLSKTFDCILHDLFIAKLAAYGFDYNSLQCCKATSQTENKEKKLMMRIVSIVKFCSELHKALYFVRSSTRLYLIFIYVTCFMILMIAILRVMLMIILLTQVAAI